MKNRIEILTEMLIESPNDVFLNYAFAMEKLSLSDFNSCVEILEKIKTIDAQYLPLYYQLAKVYEKLSLNDLAINTYEQGIELAISLKEQKTANELRSALEELTF